MALLLIVFVDALWTALWVDGGGGPLTGRMTTYTWRAVLRLAGRRRHRLLSLFGPAIILTVLATWLLLLWAGWVFVFSGTPESLVGSSGPKAPADWSQRIWFVAFSISTMGNGDFTPSGDVWEIAASLTTLSGFVLATMVISYLLSVLAAVVEKRAFAGQVSGLGSSAEELLTNAWDGESFRTLDLPLNTTSGLLGPLTEQYLSFPILQYYHAARPAKSPAVGLVVLDEALTLLRFGVPREYRPNAAVLHAAREGVASYLQTLKSAFIDPADDVPPPPDLDRLRQAGIPTVSDEEFSDALRGLSERRKKLLGLLRNDGWNWTDRP